MELCEFTSPQSPQHKIMDHFLYVNTCVGSFVTLQSKSPCLFQLTTSSSSFASAALFTYPKREDSSFSMPFLTQIFPIITKTSSRKNNCTFSVHFIQLMIRFFKEHSVLERIPSDRCASGPEGRMSFTKRRLSTGITEICRGTWQHVQPKSFSMGNHGAETQLYS